MVIEFHFFASHRAGHRRSLASTKSCKKFGIEPGARGTPRLRSLAEGLAHRGSAAKAGSQRQSIAIPRGGWQACRPRSSRCLNRRDTGRWMARAARRAASKTKRAAVCSLGKLRGRSTRSRNPPAARTTLADASPVLSPPAIKARSLSTQSRHPRGLYRVSPGNRVPTRMRRVLSRAETVSLIKGGSWRLRLRPLAKATEAAGVRTRYKRASRALMFADGRATASSSYAANLYAPIRGLDPLSATTLLKTPAVRGFAGRLSQAQGAALSKSSPRN